jgi:hypothetical protein
MSFKRITRVSTWAAIAVFTVLAMPVQLAAQDNERQNYRSNYHHYKLIDLGTFGGPNSAATVQHPLSTTKEWSSALRIRPYPIHSIQRASFFTHSDG